MKWIICDIDGTLADMTRRVVHMPDWDAVHEDIENDPCYPKVVELVQHLELHWRLVLLTGRPERYRAKTAYWLKSQNVIHEQLLMRPDENFMKDPDLKWHLALEFFGSEEEVKEEVFMVIDDIDRCVQMWRDKGLFCVQPRIGDY